MENKYIFLRDTKIDERFRFRTFFSMEGTRESRDKICEDRPSFGSLEFIESYKVVKIEDVSGETVKEWIFDKEDFWLFEDLFLGISNQTCKYYRNKENFENKVPHQFWH